MKRRILIKRKMKKYHWLIILSITVFITMYVYGMTRAYFPDPIYMGAGQYLDIGTGIVIVGLLLLGAIIAILFKKKKRKKS